MTGFLRHRQPIVQRRIAVRPDLAGSSEGQDADGQIPVGGEVPQSKDALFAYRLRNSFQVTTSRVCYLKRVG